MRGFSYDNEPFSATIKMKYNAQIPLPIVHHLSSEELGLIYQLSQKHSPPVVDFREADKLDDHGDENFSSVFKSKHLTIDDVTDQELEQSVCFSFMLPEDHLFYLYPVVSAFLRGIHVESLCYLFYGFDRLLPEIIELLKPDELILVQKAWRAVHEHQWSLMVYGRIFQIPEGACLEIQGNLPFSQCKRIGSWLGIDEKPCSITTFEIEA